MPTAPPGITRQLPAALRWSIGPTLLFVCMLLILLAMGLWARWAPVSRPGGLPDDADVAAARELLGGELPMASRGLYMVTAFAGECRTTAPESLPFAPLTAAHARLLAAARRHPDDPRLAATLTHLELACLRLEKAERDYRVLLDREPHDGETRLGLGIALALRADWAGAGAATEPGRLLALEALAQFTNVDRDDPAHWAALYDRAVMLSVVGRRREAGAALATALSEGPPPPWGDRYRRLAAPRGR
ncbi:MAG: tetratricopeptide repeat protein [Candidatus Eisenbacteria bacterium]